VLIRRLPNKTRNRYLWKHPLVRFFLLALSSGQPPFTSDAEMVSKIREREYKILVIDDDDDFRKSFCFKLKRKYKAQVEDVGAGKAGIKKLSDGNSYDFIFTDIMMPGMTGIEVYHKLREIDAKIRIIIMSAYSDSDEWKKAQELADVPLLHKPIPEDRLIKVLGV
jgi:CheY-like chemotaxis protein